MPVKPGVDVADALDLARGSSASLRDLDHAALVLGDRAEAAAAEAAAQDRHREPDHLVRRDLRPSPWRGCGGARERQLVERVHLRRRQRQRRRVEPDVAVAVALHERARVAGVRLEVQDARRVRVQHRVGRRPARSSAGGSPCCVAIGRARLRWSCTSGGAGGSAGRARASALPSYRVRIGQRLDAARRVDARESISAKPSRVPSERGAAQVADLRDRLAGGEPVRDLDDRALAVAEHEQVGLRVDQHRPPHLVATSSRSARCGAGSPRCRRSRAARRRAPRGSAARTRSPRDPAARRRRRRASTRRRCAGFRSDVYRLTIESMFPAVTPQNRFGRPSARNGSALRQSGWSRMPTRNPCASSSRPTSAMPKLGWSTYASPVTSTTSQLSQPSSSISAREVGSTGATPKRSAQYGRCENSARTDLV